MKMMLIFLCFVFVTGVFAIPPQIKVEVRFMEVCERVYEDSKGSLPTIDKRMQLISSVSDVTNIISYLNKSGEVSLLAAPRLTIQSGSNAEMKVCSEYTFPTDICVQQICVTNGEKVVKSVSVVPCNFEKYDAGVMLNVTPVYKSKDDTIDLTLTAKISSIKQWTNYTALYMDSTGSERKFDMSQPVFNIHKTEQRVVIKNNGTALLGGMTTMRHFRTVDRIPVLGYIPLLGRLFRSIDEGDEVVNLVLIVTAEKIL
jgi:type II secretory pathway component GspD/PulD (secretin)